MSYFVHQLFIHKCYAKFFKFSHYPQCHYAKCRSAKRVLKNTYFLIFVSYQIGVDEFKGHPLFCPSFSSTKGMWGWGLFPRDFTFLLSRFTCHHNLDFPYPPTHPLTYLTLPPEWHRRRVSWTALPLLSKNICPSDISSANSIVYLLMNFKLQCLTPIVSNIPF